MKKKEHDDIYGASTTSEGTAGQTPQEIGDLCAAVVARYAKPNINARTMLSMPQFWADITLALRGEGVAEPTTPVLNSLVPSEAEVGSEDFTISCLGTGFDETSVIVWNGGDEPTTLVSDTEVTTVVKPSTASGPVTIPVSVRNDQVYSGPVDFTFTAAPEADTTEDEGSIEDDEYKPRRKRK